MNFILGHKTYGINTQMEQTPHLTSHRTFSLTNWEFDTAQVERSIDEKVSIFRQILSFDQK
jgi:hypothetical protein